MMADNDPTGDDVKRRSTFTPPPEGAEFPERLGELSDEDLVKAKQASDAAAAQTERTAPAQPSPESASYLPETPFVAPAPPSPAPPPAPSQSQPTYQPPAEPPTEVSVEFPAQPPSEPVSPANEIPEPIPSGPVIPPAPVRTSLDDEQIMEQFRGGDTSSTEALMNALETQLDLRVQEDQRFADWEKDIRDLLPEKEAERLIHKSRREFDGLPPLPEPEPEPAPESQPEPAPVAEGQSQESVQSGMIPSEAVPRDSSGPEPQVEQVSNPLLAGIARDTEELPTVSDDNQGESVPPTDAGPTGFDTVLSDPDAVSPPTAAWPLVSGSENVDAESGPTQDPSASSAADDLEPVAETPKIDADDEPPADGHAGEESVQSEEIVLPRLVTSGVSVGTATVSIREVVATREIPEEPFVGITAEKERWFSFDRTGVEPAPEMNRTARILSIFWTWWSVSVPLGGILVGAWLTGQGLSLVQAILVATGGVLVGAIPLVVGTLQGVRFGLPALIVSRLTFGTVWNVIPAALMVVIRLLVAAFFVWASAWAVSGVYVEANLWRDDRVILEVLVTTGLIVVVGALAIVGRHWINLALWVAGGLSLLGAVGAVILTWDLPTRDSLTLPGASAPELVAGAAFVAAVMMILWAQAAPDIARFVAPGRGGGAAVAVGFAAVIPPVGLIAWGSLLGASDGVAQAILADPFGQLFATAPAWYPIPAVVVVALPLVALAGLALHSSGYALMSLGFAMPRYVASTVGVVVAAVAVFVVILTIGDPGPYLVDLVWLLGVVVASFVGAVAADWLTRRRHPDTKLLLQPGSGFPAVRIAPLLGFVSAVGTGWGFVVSDTTGFGWLGYIVSPLDAAGVIDLTGFQAGVFVALLLSAVVTSFAGIRGGVIDGAKKTDA